MYMSRKSCLKILLLMLLVLSQVNAQDEETTGSNRSLMFDLTSTQTSYSDSWVGGEAGSVNWVANLNTTITQNLRDNLGLRSRL